MDDSAILFRMIHQDMPLRALEMYEQSTRMAVTLHVRDVRIWPMLPPTRSWHDTPACRAAKQLDDPGCVVFDQEMVGAELQRRPGGFVKICHAGLVEWVAAAHLPDPKTRERTPAIILFAGQARAGEDLHKLRPLCATKSIAQMLNPNAKGKAKSSFHAGLPAVSAEAADLQLELLCQLAARLEQWLGGTLGNVAGSDKLPAHAGDRKHRIDTFMRQQHVNAITIDDLAHTMTLSPSRAAHVVQSIYKRSFGQLLTEARIRTAASLLRHTNLSVLEVALRSGFGDVSNFHRRFRSQLNLSPLQYRKKAEVLTPLTISSQV